MELCPIESKSDLGILGGRGKPFNPENGHARGGADGEYRGRGRGRGYRGGAERGESTRIH